MFDEIEAVNKICNAFEKYIEEEESQSIGIVPLTIEINNSDGDDKIFLKSYKKEIITPIVWMNIFNAVKLYLTIRSRPIIDWSFDGKNMEITFPFDEMYYVAKGVLIE